MPEAATRRMGWVQYPVTCPSCGVRLKEAAVITHGGALRCERGCSTLLYVLPATHHGVAFVAEITPSEAVEIRERSLSLAATLDYLGARFPEAA
ncbi:MAG: hypothetical protein U9Q74_05290 [Gemmatimonadota bacterium]|nr:hypothetical protein [Gemmatimonadota bacterium]